MPAGNWTATSKLKQVEDDAFICDITVRILPPVSPSTMSILVITADPSVSALWPEKLLKLDIKCVSTAGEVYVLPGAVAGPVYVRPERGVTNG
jgi:hypothetical protein